MQRPPLRARRLTVGFYLGAVVAAAAIAITALAGLPAGSVNALAPCLLHTNTGEESQFVGLLQTWRNSNIPGSFPLTVSAPLNAAAAGYAQFLANTPGAGGHFADGGGGSFPWAARAVQCGYPADQAAGGEGLAVVESSVVVNVSAQQALNVMTSERGGGVWVPSNVGLPVKCVGAAKMVSGDGKKVAWVTVLFAASGTCPQAATGGTAPSPSASASPTSTNTPTPTATPTNTPTPSPTPTLRADGAKITLSPGWNLVILPAGPLGDILYRARGCYSAVYQQVGDHWLRYSNDVPPYARNLVTSNGGAFWIEGTAASCGPISL